MRTRRSEQLHRTLPASHGTDPHHPVRSCRVDEPGAWSTRGLQGRVRAFVRQSSSRIALPDLSDRAGPPLRQRVEQWSVRRGQRPRRGGHRSAAGRLRRGRAALLRRSEPDRTRNAPAVVAGSLATRSTDRVRRRHRSRRLGTDSRLPADLERTTCGRESKLVRGRSWRATLAPARACSASAP